MAFLIGLSQGVQASVLGSGKSIQETDTANVCVYIIGAGYICWPF